MEDTHALAHSVINGGDVMKIPERTGMWVEMSRSSDRDDEITVEVPNGIWAGWMLSVRLNDQDIAEFLRSIGWQVVLPTSVRPPIAARK